LLPPPKTQPSPSPPLSALSDTCPPSSVECGWDVYSNCARLTRGGCNQDSRRRLFLGNVWRSVIERVEFEPSEAVPFNQTSTAFWFDETTNVAANLLSPNLVNTSCRAFTNTPECNHIYWEVVSGDGLVHEIKSANNKSLVSDVVNMVNEGRVTWEDIEDTMPGINCTNAINTADARRYIERSNTLQSSALSVNAFNVYNASIEAHRMLCSVQPMPNVGLPSNPAMQGATDGARPTNMFEIMFDEQGSAYFGQDCPQGYGRKLTPQNYPIPYLTFLLALYGRYVNQTTELNVAYTPRPISTYPQYHDIPCQALVALPPASPPPPSNTYESHHPPVHPQTGYPPAPPYSTLNSCADICTGMTCSYGMATGASSSDITSACSGCDATAACHPGADDWPSMGSPNGTSSFESGMQNGSHTGMGGPAPPEPSATTPPPPPTGMGSPNGTSSSESGMQNGSHTGMGGPAPPPEPSPTPEPSPPTPPEPSPPTPPPSPQTPPPSPQTPSPVSDSGKG